MSALEVMRQCKIYPRLKEIWQRANDGWTQPEETKKKETCVRRKITLAPAVGQASSLCRIGTVQ